MSFQHFQGWIGKLEVWLFYCHYHLCLVDIFVQMAFCEPYQAVKICWCSLSYVAVVDNQNEAEPQVKEQERVDYSLHWRVNEAQYWVVVEERADCVTDLTQNAVVVDVFVLIACGDSVVGYGSIECRLHVVVVVVVVVVVDVGVAVGVVVVVIEQPCFHL